MSSAAHAASSSTSASAAHASFAEDAALMSSSDSDHALDYDREASAPGNDKSDGYSSDGDASTASASEAERSSRRRRRQRIHFGVEQLQAVYHLPLKMAAERLGICEAALKRICRRNHIRKWPYRQLSSVRRRIAELKDQRVALFTSLVGGGRMSDHHTDAAAASPEQLDVRLRQLEDEQANIVRSAHRPKKSSNGRQSTATSWLQRPVPGEALTILLHDYDRAAQQPAPLDLRRIDRDFPLLLLANVCESVRALHST
ncbi:RWP-RK domain [Phytophthora cinnamomi]|uniref:RWP-RK domain n=1 Tax=Phytophthora cinnamomi TaxID=4785 RepID=UPI00355A5722|nr:RWP-RK domain [Phytophthora cinnamomi]